MALVPAGSYLFPFRAGDKDGRQLVKPFRLDKRPVSISEFHAFVLENLRWSKSGVKRLFADSTYLAAWTGKDAPPPGSGAKAVTQVSWYAAKDYCASRGKRLPSTAEWERAALQVPEGMDSAAYSAGVLDWYSRPAAAGGIPTGRFGSRNAFGVKDLFGNVWEWTSDFNNAGPVGRGEGSAKDASFFCGGAGAAAMPGIDYATFMRYAFRSSLKPDFTLATLGFRCAQDLP